METLSRIHKLLSANLLLTVLVLYGFNVFLLWPGVIQADTSTALALAKSGEFSGHVPVAYVKLWSLLFPHIFEQTPMLLLQVGLLWLGIYIFSQSVRTPLAQLVFLFLPFYPVYFHVNVVVLREPQFIYAIFAGIALMTQAHAMKKKLSGGRVLTVLLLFIYAAAIKYQIRFVLPVMLAGVFYQAGWFDRLWRAIAVALVVAVPYGHGLNHLDNLGVKPHQQTHSWQCVKIYDLAAMSYYSDTMLVPEFLKVRPEITLQDVKGAYTDQWETLITFPNAPLRKAIKAEEREALMDAWWSAVLNHPIAYMQHRLYGIYRMFTGLNVGGDKPRPWAEKPLDEKVKAVGRRIFSYMLQFPFLLLYFFWALRRQNEDPLYPTIVFTSFVVFAYILTIMFHTLAFVPRYVYICNVLTVMMHPLVIDIYLRKYQGKGLTAKVK